MKVLLRVMIIANLISLLTTKGLFGAPDEDNFSMDETRMDDIPQISMEKNDLLAAEYSEEEVRKAIFQLEHNKALGLDGFPAKLTKFCGIPSNWTFYICLTVFMLDN
jgi:hypothetical protein